MIDNGNYLKYFYTPEIFNKTKRRHLFGPNGWMLFVACNSGIDLAMSVKKDYENMLKKNKSELDNIPILGTKESPLTTVFEDTETCPRLPEHVAGANAFVFQCIHEKLSGNTVNENIQQLLQVVRTLKAHKTKNITVVTPYSPYSRQDKPSFMQREATLAKLFADQLKVAGADIHLTYHPHALSLFGLYEPDMMLLGLSGLDLFIEMFKEKKGLSHAVAVSTDSGGAKFTLHYSDAMNISLAIVNKFRKAKDKTDMIGIIGDLDNKKIAMITDDETVTGSSLLNVVKNLYTNYNIEEIYVAISHMKINKRSIDKFIDANKNYGLCELHITDTIPQIKDVLDLDFVTVHTLSNRFAATINRLHYNLSVSKMFHKSKNS